MLQDIYRGLVYFMMLNSDFQIHGKTNPWKEIQKRIICEAEVGKKNWVKVKIIKLIHLQVLFNQTNKYKNNLGTIPIKHVFCSNLLNKN